MDRDGALNADEFAIALFLTEKAKFGLTLPTVLPDSLRPSRAAASIGGGAVGGAGAGAWLVTPIEKNEADRIFATLDYQRVGLVSGAQLAPTMQASGLPQGVLGQIWYGGL